MRSTTFNPLALTLLSALLVTVAGCGGSDDDPVAAAPPPPPPPPQQPTPVTLQGAVMVDQGIKNAVVCMDLNANSACDGDEPASARTDAGGAYSLTYDASKIGAPQVAAAQLIATLLPGAVDGPDTAMDAADPGASATASPYVLRQVPGKSGQINPLTTLVAQGVADGMTEAAARSNAALQLGIAEAKIDNYQDDPVSDAAQVQDNARTMAVFTASALQHGAVLKVGDQMAAAEASASDLANLTYTDSANYSLRFFSNLAKAAGTPGVPYSDQRAAMTNGVAATNPAALYPMAYLTPADWKRCAADAQHVATAGNPSRSVYCDTNVSVGYSLYTDIAGQSMASAIQNLQADPVGNTINNGVPTGALLAAVGSATFPAGSQLRQRTGLNLSQHLFISDTRTPAIPQAQASTLEQLVSARPASGVNLATSAGSLSLGLGASALRNLRVAFTGITSATEGTVQFYDCDLSVTDVASNCSASNTGTYHIDTVNGVRVMRFEGLPAAPASGQNNFYAEMKGTATGDYIFRVRQTKPTQTLAMTSAMRLNATAWAALKGQLGL